MSAATSAIRASHAARRRHSASIRDPRADRHPNEPHSGPLRPFRAVGGTPWDTPWIGPPWRLAAAALHASPAAGLQRPVLNAVSAARRWSAPCTIRLTYRLCRQDCSLCDGVTNRRSYLSTKPGQLQGEVAPGLDACIDQPRVYRGEQIPRALPWQTVQTLLAAIDRTTAMGRRDYAMFLLMATYGLRASEVTAVHLDHIAWRARQFRVLRSKTQTPIVLPLTLEVGAALLDYLRHVRPSCAHREVFLRVRKPCGPLRPTGVGEAFQGWRRRSALGIPDGGAHCLRHSLALHLLRQGTSLKAIGDLLGHRSMESTCVYLRLHVDDLRAAALDLPVDTEADR